MRRKGARRHFLFPNAAYFTSTLETATKKWREKMAKLTTFALAIIVTLAAIFPAAYTMGALA
jgi:hypothetical protein